MHSPAIAPLLQFRYNFVNQCEEIMKPKNFAWWVVTNLHMYHGLPDLPMSDRPTHDHSSARQPCPLSCARQTTWTIPGVPPGLQLGGSQFPAKTS